VQKDNTYEEAITQWQDARPGDEPYTMTLPQWLGISDEEFTHRYGREPLSRLAERARAAEIAELAAQIESGQVPGGSSPECVLHGCAIRRPCPARLCVRPGGHGNDHGRLHCAVSHGGVAGSCGCAELPSPPMSDPDADQLAWEQRLREQIAQEIMLLPAYTAVIDPTRDLLPADKVLAVVLGKKK
jgi:hypothetical protein